MKSVAFDHFPKVVSGKDRFWLFNPILKKRYENRPEERVRQRWVEYLFHQTKIKKSRIGFESPVKLPQERNTLRADLILHSKKMKPIVLIECKSRAVKLTSSTAEQAAKYNSKVKAKYVVLTNGIEDYWFEIKEDTVEASDNMFGESDIFSKVIKGYAYWSQRGFCSSRSDLQLTEWLTSSLNTFWSGKSGGVRQFLDFQKTVLPVPMNHYYKVFTIDEDRKLALGFVGYGRSDNYIVAVLNHNGINRGVLTINLDRYQRDKKKSVVLIRDDQLKKDLSNRHLPLDIGSFSPSQVTNLHQTLINFFD